MVSRKVETNSTPEVSGAKRRTDFVAIQIRRHFDILDGSIICAIFLAHRLDRHFTVVFDLSAVDQAM